MKAGIRRTGGSATQTVAGLLGQATRRLQRARLIYGHGTANAAEEAVFLLAQALKVPPDGLPEVLRRRLSSRVRAGALRLIERRIEERRPAAYLVGEAWLADLPFYVDERVIVPRSHIAGMLAARLSPWAGDAGAVRTALDLGTGSGCLAILLARNFPHARVDATDVSTAALAVARINIGRYRLARRVRAIESDLFAALPGKRYDLIISNPPYVTAGAMRRLPREYRHEPRIALAAGADGLGVVRRIVRSARTHLNPGGLLVVEVGRGRRRVERAFPRSEFLWPETDAGYPVFIATREKLP